MNQIAQALNAETSRIRVALPGVLGGARRVSGVRGELSRLTDEVDVRTDFGNDVFRAMALLWPDVPEQLSCAITVWRAGRRFSEGVADVDDAHQPRKYPRAHVVRNSEGKKRTRNIREKTNRIAAQMGDMGTREDFIRFCSAMRRQSQGTRLNEGYELRVSWSPEELSRDSPEDIQRACEYDYLLCKEVAPNAPCWV
ncbi:MAG: hypothetical protein ACLSDQ_11995, partial [Adlercreutzia equolifaciens]